MADKLTQKELEGIVEKIRGQYEENQKIYGPAWFSLKGFNDRFLQALRNRTDLQTFVFAEVTALEEIKKKVDEKVRERTIKTDKTFTKKIEKMIDAMSEKTRKYPALFGDSGLPEEFQHFCGAARDFHDREWLLVRRIIEKSELKELKRHADLSERFERFFIHSGKGISSQADAFLSAERREGFDKGRVRFLQEAARLLGDAASLLEEMRLQEPDKLLDLPGSSTETAVYDNRTISAVLDMAKSALRAIIADFRLTDLAKRP